jgi:diacylglycerol kinase (ATP)
MLRYKIIVNPISGRGTGGRMYPEIERKLKELKLDFDMVRTGHPWHGYELTRKAVADGYDVVVAAGGDGTANEVINGLMTAKEETGKTAAMGMIAVGRGNDFAFSMGETIQWESDCQTLADNHRKLIDIGKMSGNDQAERRFFGNGVGVGFDAVVGFVSLNLKPLRGFSSYLLGAVICAFSYYKAPLLEVNYDGVEVTMPFLMVSVMNGSRLGGGFKMAPNAKVDDGKFNLNLVSEVPPFTILYIMTKFMKGTQAEHPAVTIPLASKVTITAKRGVIPAHGDGETLCKEGQKLVLENLPRQIELIAPV